MGAALEATSLPIGAVNAPNGRYNPAIIAQAAATLAEMFPERFWVALTSGQDLSEHITGHRWPLKPERNARLKESVDLIRTLWSGQTVTHFGRVRIEEAKLWSRPERPPPIISPALSEETAEFVGGWAGGLVTVNALAPRRHKMIEAFRRGSGEGKPLYLQCHLSFAATEAEALANAHDQWRFSALPGIVTEHLSTPCKFDAATKHVRPDDLADHVRSSADLERHQEFIDTFGQQVLPALALPSRDAIWSRRK